MKRKVVMLLCAVLALSLVTGCSSGKGAKEAELPDAVTEAAKDTPGWMADTEPVTLDWYVNYSWYDSMWEEGEFSQWMEEKTGVKINFIVPSGEAGEKLNTMITGNTLPEIITLEASDPAVRQMAEAGLLYPLNELADKYDPYFYEVTSEQTRNWFAQADGNLYGYPNASISPEQYGELDGVRTYQTFNIKKDYYDAIGRPDMSTPEGFLNGLQAAQDMYGDTVDGFIPIVLHDFTETGNLSLDNFLLDYLGVPKAIDGKLYDRREDAGYQTWLKTFRKANEMGLIASNVFTDSRQQVEEEMAQKRVFAALYQNCDFTVEQQMLWDEDPNTAYETVQGPSIGNDPKLDGPGIGGWTVTCITKNCKNPERAIEFMTYWCSEEGTRDATYGKIGTSCELDGNGTPHLTQEYQDLYNNDFEMYTKRTGADPLWMLGDPVLANNWNLESPDYVEQMYFWGEDYVVSNSQFTMLDPEANTDESEIKADIDLLWGQTLPRLITAESDEEFDALLQNYFKERDALGWDKLLAFQQIKYEENLKKLGME